MGETKRSRNCFFGGRHIGHFAYFLTSLFHFLVGSGGRKRTRLGWGLRMHRLGRGAADAKKVLLAIESMAAVECIPLATCKVRPMPLPTDPQLRHSLERKVSHSGLPMAADR
eukprot:5556105-Amphidinium_carterae.1